jgi:hypothetical protein
MDTNEGCFVQEAMIVNMVKMTNGSYKTEGYFGQIWGIIADLISVT